MKTLKEKAIELVDKYDETLTYLESKSKAKQCAKIDVQNNINLIKYILDESVNVHQSLSTEKKLCIDILNPLLKENEQLLIEIDKL